MVVVVFVVVVVVVPKTQEDAGYKGGCENRVKEVDGPVLCVPAEEFFGIEKT